MLSQRVEPVRKWIKAIQSCVTRQLLLSIPEEKTSIVHLPGVIDILGLRTNGHRVWLRPTSLKRAERTIAKSIRNSDPALYDQLCSYAGMGIFVYGDMFINI